MLFNLSELDILLIKKWPKMGYTERLHPKGVPFTGFKYMSGLGFHLLKYMKGQGKLLFRLVKKLKKGLQMHYIAVERVK